MLHKQLWKIVHVGPGDLDSRVSDPDCPEPESFASENFNLKNLFVRAGEFVVGLEIFYPMETFHPMEFGWPGDRTPWMSEDLEIRPHGVWRPWRFPEPERKSQNFPAPEVVQPTHGVKSPGPIWTFFQSCLCNIVARVCRK